LASLRDRIIRSGLLLSRLPSSFSIGASQLARSRSYLFGWAASHRWQVDSLVRAINIEFNHPCTGAYPTELLALGAAAINEANYPLHLAAVEIFLLKVQGDTSPYIQAGGALLAGRDNGNPFFVYLSEGPSANVRSLVLSECPSPKSPSTGKHQWSWERPSADMAWKESMYWDCIFMGRLLGAQ
jgi:hypothetical protein